MLNNIKKWSMVLGTVMLVASCSTDMEGVNPSSTLGAVSTDAAKAQNSDAPFEFTNLTKSDDGKTWSFSVRRVGDYQGGNVSSAVLGFIGCEGSAINLSAANVDALFVTKEDGKVKDLEVLFEDDSDKKCDMSITPNHVNFTDFGGNLKKGAIFVFTIVLKDAIQVTEAKVGISAGNQCYPGNLIGFPCEEEDLCGLGQGSFQMEGSWNGVSVTLGGHNYTEAEGLAIMTPNGNSTGGLKDSRAAFSQGATVMLNRQMKLISAEAYAAQIADINAYLSTLNKLTTYDIANMPHGNKAAKDAAGYIGDHIKCEEPK